MSSRSEDVPAEVWHAILAAARLLMGRETDAVTVCHRRSSHEESAVVVVMRPGPLGNAFFVRRGEHLDEAWRDAC